MKIVAFSDTHGMHRGRVCNGVTKELVVPDGDLLIFAGDAEMSGMGRTLDFLQWFNELPHKHKVMIAGNHDWSPYKHPDVFREVLDKSFPSIHYLENSGVTIAFPDWPEGVRIWGSPYTPTFLNWAFMADRGDVIKSHWDRIPTGSDHPQILITHGPPFGYCDQAHKNGDHLGCEELAKALVRTQPYTHIFGHIHGGHGFELNTVIESQDGTTNVDEHNVSVLNENYEMVNPCTVIDF